MLIICLFMLIILPLFLKMSDSKVDWSDIIWDNMCDFRKAGNSMVVFEGQGGGELL